MVAGESAGGGGTGDSLFKESLTEMLWTLPGDAIGELVRPPLLLLGVADRGDISPLFSMLSFFLSASVDDGLRYMIL